MQILEWDVYNLNSPSSTLRRLGTRGVIRKFALVNDITLLTENANDQEHTVRFALIAGTDPTQVIEFIKSKIPDAQIQKIVSGIKNPVLSHLKSNSKERYDLDASFKLS